MQVAKMCWLIGCLVWLAAIPLPAQERAYPKSGEGIELFLKRFGRTGYRYQQEFIQINKKKLGKNNMLIQGVKYTLPPLRDEGEVQTTAHRRAQASTSKKQKGYEPLFGKQYAKYETISSELKGATFYLVSGHGGPDPGAMGKMGNHMLCEDEYAYDIILRVARNLMQRRPAWDRPFRSTK